MADSIAIKHSKIIKGPYQVSLDITNKCNFRCMHCYNRSGENPYIEEELSDEEILDFISDVIEMKPHSFCFCGGEPLLRKKLLLLGAKRLNDAGIIASFVTNGYLVDEEFAIQCKNAKIENVQISIDGSCAESHDRLRGTKGAFDKAINAIKCFNKAGVSVGIAYTPTKWNIDEFQSAYEMLSELGVSDIRCQPLMAIGRGEVNWEEICPKQSQYRELVRNILKINSQINESNKKPGVLWGDPIDHLIRFSNHINNCCMYISIKANGSIAPSLYIPLTIGNIRKYKLSEYWEYGLSRIWNNSRIREMQSMVRSVSDMTFNDDPSIPKLFMEKEIELDFIDDNLYKEILV